jgi:hypothetical protein
MYAKSKIIIFLVCIIGFAIHITGCKSVTANGIESLVESRLINERGRIRAEFAQELSEWIIEDIGRIAESVNAIGDGQAALRHALEEYRRFVLELIDRLQRVESQIPENVEMADSIHSLRGVLLVIEHYYDNILNQNQTGST